jgi:hypothetical protein
MELPLQLICRTWRLTLDSIEVRLGRRRKRVILVPRWYCWSCVAAILIRAGKIVVKEVSLRL